MEDPSILIDEKLYTQRPFLTIATQRFLTEGSADAEFVSLRGLSSHIRGSRPITISFDRENPLREFLSLHTHFYASSNGRYWASKLTDNYGLLLVEKCFADLPGLFSDYSEGKLYNWQEIAVRNHRKILSRIEELYWRDTEIPQNILNTR